MKEIAKMLIVLTLICGVCGFLLAGVKSLTMERIEEQILLNVKGPAVKKALAGSTNDLIKDRTKIKINDKEEMVIFVGKKDKKPWALAFEVSAGGFGGDIGVIVGFNKEKNTLSGIGITTHKETPGLGARITENTFTNNFKDKALNEQFKTKKDNGIIDAVSGATISSKAVCSAVTKAIRLYDKIKDKVK
ncbi:MAG: RnfABCDGE type electron transport complex subunit G [Spirochaetota bacterium]|nr:RnfABCDGE type electron transport complex subunit G [Spirochaetota bacterium]